MKDNSLDSKRVRDAMRRYNEPPETPRDEIWSRIQAERARARMPVSPWWRRIWTTPRVWVPAAAAAALVIGVTIGRLTAPVPTTDTASRGPVAENRGAGRAQAAAGNTSYRLAATPVLQQAELLLAEFAAGDPTGEYGESFSSRAGGLLADTRLLLDSPAADDPELAQVLRDLELILAQIVRLFDKLEVGDRDLIDENLKNRSLIPRLRATSPAVTIQKTT